MFFIAFLVAPKQRRARGVAGMLVAKVGSRLEVLRQIPPKIIVCFEAGLAHVASGGFDSGCGLLSQFLGCRLTHLELLNFPCNCHRE